MPAASNQRSPRHWGPRWRVRLVLCVLLGLLTSWLAAWGVAVAARSGWFGTGHPLDQRGAAYIEPLLIEYARSQNRPTIVTLWFITPLDRHTQLGANARDRYAAELPPLAPYPDGRPELAMRSASQFDQIAARFHELPVARHMSDHDLVVIEQYDFGWPLRSASQTMISRFTDAGPSLGQVLSSGVFEERWSLTIPLGRFHLPGTTLAELRLPLRPLLPALAANTVFYGLLWALPLLGLPLFKRTRRRRRGRCLLCAYDLAATPGDVCPECGCPRPATRA